MSEKPDYHVLRQSPLALELSDEEAGVLAEIMGIQHLKDEEVLVYDGEINHQLHLLTDGRIAVTKTVEGEPAMLYMLRAGEFAGTRAFVDRTPRKATLRAIGKTEVYTLDPEVFEALLETHPHIVYAVMRAIFRTVHSTLMRIDMENEELKNYIYRTHGRY
jgi:CRP-like cAMP-binding protein